MINLYELLNIKPSSNQSQIQQALNRAAEKRLLSIEQLQKVKNVLLNEDKRSQYDTALFVAYPDLKIQVETELQAHNALLEKQQLVRQKEQEKKERIQKVKSVVNNGLEHVQQVAENMNEKKMLEKTYKRSKEYKLQKLKTQLQDKNMVSCNKCGEVGRPVIRGNILITLILFCCGIVPGIIYMIWRRGGKVCSKCKSNDVVYTASAQFQQQFNQKIAETICPFCSETILKNAIKCKHCQSNLT